MNSSPEGLGGAGIAIRLNLRILGSASVGLWLLALLAIGSPTVHADGVTNIKEIVNNTRGDFEVRRLDTPYGGLGVDVQNTGRIPANGGVWSGNMWIPWAVNADEHTEKHIEVLAKKGVRRFPEVLFTIWQQGDLVRFHNVRRIFISNAPVVPGVASAGGERRMIVSTEGGRIVFAIENFR